MLRQKCLEDGQSIISLKPGLHELLAMSTAEGGDIIQRDLQGRKKRARLFNDSQQKLLERVDHFFVCVPSSLRSGLNPSASARSA